MDRKMASKVSSSKPKNPLVNTNTNIANSNTPIKSTMIPSLLTASVNPTSTKPNLTSPDNNTMPPALSRLTGNNKPFLFETTQHNNKIASKETATINDLIHSTNLFNNSKEENRKVSDCFNLQFPLVSVEQLKNQTKTTNSASNLFNSNIIGSTQISSSIESRVKSFESNSQSTNSNNNNTKSTRIENKDLIKKNQTEHLVDSSNNKTPICSPPFGKNNSQLNDSGDNNLNNNNDEIYLKNSMLEMIKRRLYALKQLQIKSALIEAQFYEELYLMECKYEQFIKPLKEMRRKIINGEHEPTEEESDLKIINERNGGGGSGGGGGDSNMASRNVASASADNDEIFRESEISRDLIALSISHHTSKGQFIKGIPEFWLNVFKRVDLIQQMIEEYDEPILKYLTDVDVDLVNTKPYNFTLLFHFAPNEYFYESCLTKNYQFKIVVDSNDPYVFEAPETEKSRGCSITWKKGKNVTRKLIEKKQQLSNSKTTQLNQLVEEKQASFFNFFSTLESENKPRNILTSEEEAELAIDYEVGYTFKEKVIPRAILYYMGEIFDETDQSDFEDDDADDENDFANDKDNKSDDDGYNTNLNERFLRNCDPCENKNNRQQYT